MPSPTGGVPPHRPTHLENSEQTTNTSATSPRPQEQLSSTGPSFQQQQRAGARYLEAQIRGQVDARKRGYSPTGESSEESVSPRASPSSTKRVRQNIESHATDSAAAIPVIKEMEAEEARAALEEFRKSVEQWGVRFGANAGSSDSSQPVAQASTAGGKEKWATRLEQTKDIIAEIEETDCEGSTVYTCQAKGQPIGMLLLDEMATPCVSRIVTHPESKGVGSALIEQAVNTFAAMG